MAKMSNQQQAEIENLAQNCALRASVLFYKQKSISGSEIALAAKEEGVWKVIASMQREGIYVYPLRSFIKELNNTLVLNGLQKLPPDFFDCANVLFKEELRSQRNEKPGEAGQMSQVSLVKKQKLH